MLSVHQLIELPLQLVFNMRAIRRQISNHRLCDHFRELVILNCDDSPAVALRQHCKLNLFIFQTYGDVRRVVFLLDIGKMWHGQRDDHKWFSRRNVSQLLQLFD